MSFTTLEEPAPVEPMSVTTDSATTITKASATLHGTVTSLGENESVTAGFLYGTSANALTGEAGTTNLTAAGSFSGSLTSLSDNTKYYYCAFARAGGETVYGDTLSFTTLKDTGFTCGVDSVADHEGNLYATVKIGTQCWTKQNMRCTTAPDGTVTLEDGYGTYSYSTPYYYEPTGSMTVNDTTYTKKEYVEKYGRLYNYPAAMASDDEDTNFEYPHRGICPEGWHVPTDEEWKAMATFVFNSTDPNYKCPNCTDSIEGNYYNCIAKALTATTDWDESSSTCAVGNDLSANNATGFSALPAGYYYYYDYYDDDYDYGIYGAGSSCYFWSATPDGEDYVYSWVFYYPDDYLYRGSDSRYYGFPVRCLRDPMAVTTDSASPIIENSATLHGTVTNLGFYNSASVGFKYGTSDETMATTVTVGNVTGTGPFSFDIEVLAAATVYFRAFVANGTDTVWGEVKYITPSSTMSVTTDSATNVNYRSAILHGTLNGLRRPEATIAGFVYGTAENALTKNITKSVSVTGGYNCHINNLFSHTTYYYKAFETDGTDTTYGEVRSFTTTTFTCGSSIDDHEGNLYATVQIGTQCWTKQNMRCTTAPDGTVTLKNGNGTYSYNMPYYYEPTGSMTVNGNTYTKEAYVEKFGRLYNYPAAMAIDDDDTNFEYLHRGICPEGWHVPTDDEWHTMATFVYNSTDPVYKCPSCSGSIDGNTYQCIAKALAATTDWDESSSTCAVGNDLSANNATGFSALPAGYYSDGFNSVGFSCYFWSASPDDEDYAYRWYLYYDYEYLRRSYSSRYYGEAVRCIQNMVTTDSASHITSSSATLHGTITSLGENASVAVGFQYGHTRNAMESTGTVGNVTATGPFSFDIDGLAAATVYFRAFAANGEDTVWGEVKYLTPLAPMSVTTNTATHIGKSSATLHGTINGLSNPEATTAGFVYGTAENALTNNVAKSMSVTGKYDCRITNLSNLTTYYYKAFETDGIDTVYGEVKDFTTNKSTCGIDSVADHEGNKYATVQIGTQCWTKQNMRCKSAPDGTVTLKNGNDTYSYSTPYYYEPTGSMTVNGTTYTKKEYVEKFGRLYNYPGAMAINNQDPIFDYPHRGICPEGWHMPTNDEWHTMATFVFNSTDPNYKCPGCSDSIDGNTYYCIAKALADSTDWDEYSITCAVGNDLSANNATGFSALPAGYATDDGFYTVGSYIYFWSATLDGGDQTYEWYLGNSNSYLYRNTSSRYFGNAVRCIQDIVITDSASHITSSSATLHGTITSLGENASVAVGFQYGHTRNAMESTGTVGNVTATGPFSFDIDGLAAATVYFRAFAANGEDTAWGEVKHFTPIVPMSVTTDSTTHIGGTSALLHGTINGMSNPEATTAGFVYGTAENALTNSVAESMSVTGEYDCRITNLSNLTTYYYKAFETDGIDTVYGEVLSFTTAFMFTCGIDSVADHEGNKYATVQMGTQCWTKQNMRCTTAPDGTVTLENGYGDYSYSTPYYYKSTYMKNDYVEKYGLLYNYPAAMAINNQDTIFDYPHRGICPQGWHVPTDEEWKTMATFVFNSADPNYKCPDCTGSIEGNTYHCIGKALAATTDWSYDSDNCDVGNNLSANNATGFSALPAGYYYYYDDDEYDIYEAGSYANFWSATPSSEYSSYSWELYYDSDYLYHDFDSRYYGYSVRCIHDSAKLGVTTDSVSNVNTHTATLNGTVTEIDDELVSFAGFQYGHSESDMENRLVYGQMTSPGSFSSNIDILDASTVYYRAFVNNSEGIVWGEIKHFTPIADMSVVTNSATNIISSSATLHGTIHGLSNPDATIAGFIYGTDQNNLSSSVETSVSITGNYSINTGGLTPSTTYYYQAFESDGEVTVFGDILSFKTAESIEVTTDSLQIVEGNIIKLHGAINYLGGHAAVAAGFKYGTSQDELNTTVTVGTAITNTGAYSSKPIILISNTTYYYQAFAAYETDTAWGIVKTYVSPMFQCGTSVVQDIDGNNYNTVQIGSQCWMKENLKTTYGLTKRIDYFYPGNDTVNVNDYGLLYTWNTANQSTSSTTSDVQSICPPGWRMPSDSDVYTLTKYVFDNYRCEDCSSRQWIEKADCVAPALASKYGWNTYPNTSCAIGNDLSKNDTTGFSAMPAGNGPENFSHSAYFWTSASNNSNGNGYFFRMHADRHDVWIESSSKSSSYSVRCLYYIDMTDISVVTDIATDRLDHSATLHGNVNGVGDGLSVTAGFKYGTDQNALEASVTKSETITTTESYSCNIRGLNPTTTYYYKAFGVSGNDTIWGEVKSFTTIELQPVNTDSADNISYRSATLHGTVNELLDENGVTAGFLYGTSEDALTNETTTLPLTETGSFECNLSNLSNSTTYYYCAFATAGGETVYGEILSFTTNKFFSCGKDLLEDIEGNQYATVKLGSQCWMAENLRTVDSLTYDTDYHYPDDNADRMNTYGLLYTWKAAFKEDTLDVHAPIIRGICPEGWHLPSNDEWDRLAAYVKRQPAYRCDNVVNYISKSLASTSGWVENNMDCAVGNNQSKNNASGFNAFPAGVCQFINFGYANTGTAIDFGKYTRFWTSTVIKDLVGIDSIDLVRLCGLDYEQTGLSWQDMPLEINIGEPTMSVDYGFSVRCVWNLLTVTTDSADNITYNSADLHGTMAVIDNNDFSASAGFVYGTTPDALNRIQSVNITQDGTYNVSIQRLTPNTLYYYRAFVVKDNDTVWSNNTKEFSTAIFQFFKPCVSDPTVTDDMGNVYPTVQIGTQCWMAQNIRTTQSISQEDYKCPNNDSLNVEKYGYLYSWEAATNNNANSLNPAQGICPAGWQIPYVKDVDTLKNYLARHSEFWCNNNSSSIAKSLASREGWTETSYPCSVGFEQQYKNDATGFNAYPDGGWNNLEEFSYFGKNSRFWLYNEKDVNVKKAFKLGYGEAEVNMPTLNSAYTFYFPVRCVRIERAEELPVPSAMMSVITHDADAIEIHSATLNGTIEATGVNVPVAAGFRYGASEDAMDSIVTMDNFMNPQDFSFNITNLDHSVTCYYQAFVTDGADTVWGEVMSFTTRLLCGLDSVTDIDGNRYSTVKIGTQCWMQSNLRTKRYADGGAVGGNAEIFHVKGDESNDATYGLLYNWAAVMGTDASSNTNPSGVQGICPDGWHVPSDAEWTQLTNYVNSKSIYLCSSENTNYVAPALASNKNGDWTYSIRECAVGNHPSNATGFSALPAGNYSSTGHASFGENADFWSATQYSASNAHRRDLNYTGQSIFDYTADKALGYSVRCLSNLAYPITMHVTTDNADNKTNSSATLHGILHEMGEGHTSVKVGFKYGLSADALDREIVSGAALSTSGAFSCELTGLTEGTDYYYRAFATAGNDTVWGSIYTVHSFICGVEKLTDIDNNKYATVKIGAQCWMAENLRTMSDLFYVAPNNNDNNINTYGLLYTWNRATKGQASDETHPMVQGICPEGWHIPSKDEWETMTKYVFDQPYYRCGSCSTWEENTGCISKALASTTGWRTSADNPCLPGSDTSTNNKTGFNAVPAGGFLYNIVFSDAIYYGFDSLARFHTSTVVQAEPLDYSWTASVNGDSLNFQYGKNAFLDYSYLSVRCVADFICPLVMNVATDSCNKVSNNSVLLHGMAKSLGDNDEVTVGFKYGRNERNLNQIVIKTVVGASPYACFIDVEDEDSIYYYKAFMTNGTDTVWGETLSFSNVEFACGTDKIYDVEGNSYATIQIGAQCWMAENLRKTEGMEYDSDYFYPDGRNANVGSHGFLYTFNAATQNDSTNIQGICPDGWHIPSDVDWDQMTSYVFGQTQYRCGTCNQWEQETPCIANALASTTGWESSTNSCAPGKVISYNAKTGFNAMPAGYYQNWVTSKYHYFGEYACFWTSTCDPTAAYYYQLSYDKDNILRDHNKKTSFTLAASIRCIIDNMAVSTDNPSNVLYHSATLNGTVKSLGAYPSVTIGFRYGTATDELNTVVEKDSPITAPSSYSHILNVLPATTYYYQAFEANDNDTVWGTIKNFTTPSAVSVTTDDAGNVTYHSATLNATINELGGYPNVWTGFKYGTEPNNLSQKILSNAASQEIGTYNGVPTDLISETTYYYQAFVFNETDTSYGEVESFTTKGISEVATDSTFQITNNATSLYGTVKNLGGCPTVAVGFKYGTNADALYNVVTCDEMLTNIGTFSYKIGGLNDSTNYYYQAFVTHLSDTVYGQIKNFTTKFISVTTDSANQVTNSSASLCGSTELGGNTLVIAGFRYGTNSSSLSGMVSKRVTEDGYYNCDINGLLQNTTYYYQAFLIDGTGFILDDVKSFTTSGPIVVNTDSITDITNCSATMHGTIEELSGHSSLTAGFIFGTSQNALTETVKTIADGAFSCEISAPITLNPNTTYYYKAFAATDNETFYGEIKTFTTLNSIVTTNNAKTIKNTEATLQARIENPVGTVTVGFKYGPKFLNMNTVVSVSQTQSTQDFSKPIIDLTPRETYYYKAFAASGRDTVWGAVKTFTTTDDCNNGLRYGSQCWARSNVENSRLYTWQEATGGINSNAVPSGVQGVCPKGWHLPSRAEWEIFMNYMYNEGRETFSATVDTWTGPETAVCPAKAMASKSWPCKDTYAEQITVRHPFAYTPGFESSTTNNRSGFAAEPYGIVNINETAVSERGDNAYFWSSTIDHSSLNIFGTNATSFMIIGFRSDPVLNSTDVRSAISVRCLRNYGTPTPARSVTTNAASKINDQSATLNGTVNALGDLTNYVVAGFKYGTDQNQLNSIVKNQEPVTRPGDFSCKISNLSLPKYYYKAFAAVGTDTTWGETKYFDNIVSVTTDSVRNVKHYSAEVFCTAKNVQPGESVFMGIAYGTSDGAMTMQVVNSDKHDYAYSIDFPYSYKLTNLTPSTQYYYQAYVIREGDTVFATDVKTFKTHSAVALSVSTDSCSNITRGSGILNGTLNRFDGSDSVKIGFKYCEVVFNNMEEYNNMNKLSLKAGQVTRAEDPRHFSASLASLKPNTYYYYVAYAVYQEDTVYGKIEKFKTATVPCSGQLRPNEGGTNGAITSVTDIDNNVYGVVQIGPQCWMTENLKTTKYIDGTEISQNSDDNNNPKLAGFGLFYDWDVVAKGRQTAESISYGLCPQGWKIPTMEDWTALMDYSGAVCMDISSFSYCVMDSFVDNTSGFSFYNTGYYGTDSVYTYDEYYNTYGCPFRIATDYSDPKVASILMRRNQGSSLCYYVGGKDISNVRCVRSESIEELTVVTNGATNNNTETSATCNYTISQNIGINVTERGICWNTGGNPSLNNSHTSDGAGTGTFTSSISGLNPGITYRVRAYATDGDTVIYGNVVSFTTLKCGNGKIKDVDGNEYETVKIGSQCWMKSNLRVTHFANGDAISGGLDQSSTNAYCYFDKNDNIDVTLYGRLYNWAAAVDNAASPTANPSGIQGVCPAGWHLPSKSEWDQLTNYISENMLCLCENPIYVLSSVAKSMAYNSMWAQTPTSQNPYPSCNPGGNQSSNNGSGFSAIPAGYYNGSFSGKSQYAEFWSSTQENTSNAWCLEIGYDSAAPNIQSRDKSSGFSIRCVLD